jgi:hypothetical protein
MEVGQGRISVWPSMLLPLAAPTGRCGLKLPQMSFPYDRLPIHGCTFHDFSCCKRRFSVTSDPRPPRIRLPLAFFSRVFVSCRGVFHSLCPTPAEIYHYNFSTNAVFIRQFARTHSAISMNRTSRRVRYDHNHCFFLKF